MKKLINIAIIALLPIAAIAGNCPSLSGSYIIGASDDATYKTIDEAVSALKCGGVSSSVNFLIENGVYNEKITLSEISGASAFNTITFESKSGENTSCVVASLSGEATVAINGASFIAFENMTFDRKTATYGNAMKVDGKASSLRFKGIIFDGVEAARTGANSATVYFTSNASKSDIVIEDCEINNGSCGIYKGGAAENNLDTKTTITGSLFFNQFETAIALSNEDAPVLSSNVVSTLSSHKDFKGISLNHVVNKVTVNNNIVNAANGGYGIWMNDCKADEWVLGQINNNSIAVGGSGNAFGIYLTGATDHQVFNFNRVKITTASATNQAYYRNVGSGNNVNMTNEIFYDLNSGDYTVVGNTYKDMFNQLPAQSNKTLTASANGLMVEKVSPIK